MDKRIRFGQTVTAKSQAKAHILSADPATDGQTLRRSLPLQPVLERIFVKLGVKTRTAAAGMAMTRIRQLHPQCEG